MVAGAIVSSSALSEPANWNSAAGDRSQSPRHGLRSHVACPSAEDVPGGPIVRSSVAQIASAPASLQAMSSQTCATRGARATVENIA